MTGAAKGMLLALLTATASGGAALAQTGAEPLPDWLAGCWIAEAGGRTTEECWTAPRGSMLLGSSQTVHDGRTTGFEYMRIERQADGLAFVAQPGGAPPTRFALAAVEQQADGAPRLIFVNAATDYPQRIRYWREGEMLVADIALADGSSATVWRYRRAGSPAE